jgi:hypothetical protein
VRCVNDCVERAIDQRQVAHQEVWLPRGVSSRRHPGIAAVPAVEEYDHARTAMSIFSEDFAELSCSLR